MANSKVLTQSLDVPTNQFRIVLKNASVTRISGATGGAFVYKLISNFDGSVLRTVSTFITPTATTYTCQYTGATNSAVSSIQLYCTGTTTTVSQALKFSFDGLEIDAYTLPKWTGYIQPDFTQKKKIPKAYQMAVFATDTLADLKSIPLPYTDPAISGNSVSIFNVIKTCLKQTGINLDFRIQNNIWESHGGANYNAFFYLINPTQRYTKLDSDGNITVADCYTVIESLLREFNCKLFQCKNYYTITNQTETNSRVVKYKNKDLSTTGYTFYNRVVAIDNYQYTIDSDSQSRVRPLKQINYQIKNAYISDNYLNGRSWSNGTGSTGFYSFFNGVTYYRGVNTTGFGNPNSNASLQSQTFPVTLNGVTYLTVSFTTLMKGKISTGSPDQFPPSIKIDLMNGNSVYATDTEVGFFGLIDGNRFASGGTKNYLVVFPITSSFTASVRLTVVPQSTYTLLDTTFSNFSANETFSGNSVFDLQYQVYSPLSTAIDVEDNLNEISFIDSNITTRASMKYNTTGATSSWNNWSGVTGSLSGVTLPLLYGYNRLVSKSKFADYLTLEMRKNYNVDFDNGVRIGSKNYNIISMSHNLQANTSNLEIVENVTTPIPNIQFNTIQLTSSDD